MNAYEVLTDASRRTEYDFTAEQEYIRMQEQSIALQKTLINRSQGTAAADAELVSNHQNMTRLAVSMCVLMLELKTIPDGHWEKREQQHQAEVTELRKSIVSHGEYLKIRFQHMQKLSTELAQERKKAHDAETRYANLVEAFRNQLTTYINFDRLRKLLGILDDKPQTIRHLAFCCLGATDESIEVKLPTPSAPLGK